MSDITPHVKNNVQITIKNVKTRKRDENKKPLKS